jgi:enoyl-CoA hydratase/carnithine racemase
MVIVPITGGDAELADLAALHLARPWLLIGVHESGSRPTLSEGLVQAVDVLLTVDERPERPWVGVGDIDDTISLLAQQLDGAPAACVTLGQILRAGEHSTLAEAFLYESLAFSTLLAGPDFARWLAVRVPRSAKPEPAEPVIVDRVGERLEVMLNRPHAHNAFNAVLRDALVEALGIALVDNSISAVRLSGLGPSFCSGGDLREFGTAPDVATAHLVRTTRSPVLLLNRLGTRAEVRLHGACIGAGAEMSAACARVVASPGTYFALPEVSMGLVPGAGGTATLPRRIGRHRTCYMALTGERISVDTALDWGLVDAIEPANHALTEKP